MRGVHTEKSCPAAALLAVARTEVEDVAVEVAVLVLTVGVPVFVTVLLLAPVLPEVVEEELL